MVENITNMLYVITNMLGLGHSSAIRLITTRVYFFRYKQDDKLYHV